MSRVATVTPNASMFILARFHARAGNEGAVARVVLDVLAPSREEPGCLSIHAFRSSRDPQLFYISRVARHQIAMLEFVVFTQE